jgi:hypothetical protein
MSHQVKSSNDVIFQHVCSMHQQHVFEEKKNVFQVLKEILFTKHKKLDSNEEEKNRVCTKINMSHLMLTWLRQFQCNLTDSLF